MDWSLFNRPAPSYDADDLTVWHKTVDFLSNQNSGPPTIAA